jgi:alpha-beta hydrolase superfamily lysophospholipase
MIRRGIAIRLLLLAISGLAACAPVTIPAGSPYQRPSFASDAMVMSDGARLPYNKWLPREAPRAILLGVHGFGDYSFNAFDIPAPLFNDLGIAIYAYDQRGFGAAPHGGLWPGSATLAADVTAVTRLVKARHPGVPVFLVGESMGAAVLVIAATSADPPPAAGYVLMAPGVRGRASMGRFASNVLEFASRTIPAVGFSGSVPGIVPTDNEDALRRWSADPLTTKAFRVDLVYGLVNLMDEALAAAPSFEERALILYGGRDAIVPESPIRQLLKMLPEAAPHRLAYYPDGYHLLLRDRARSAAVRDIAAWIEAPEVPLPSGAEQAGAHWLGSAGG